MTKTSAQTYLDEIKDKLYGDSTVAKIWGVAASALEKPEPPTEFPNYAPEGKYVCEDKTYWTSGFFPGSVYALLERCHSYPDFFPNDKINEVKLAYAARWWAEPMVSQATRTDNHDLGFMIAPSFKREWTLTKSKKSEDVIVTAANALASRFDEKVGCIRSWDDLPPIKDGMKPKDFDKDFLVIIDNMCNLNLLYLGAYLSRDFRLSTIATKHAETTLKNHFRDDWSSYHVVQYNRHTGEVDSRYTAQGFSDESGWSRGQAWGILGYIETYFWTKDKKFLEASKNITKYFISQLPEDGVPAWDFDAPDKNIRDVSAAMAAALGIIRIYEIEKDEEYLKLGLKLVRDCIKLSYNGDAKFSKDGTVDLGATETILNNSTYIHNPACSIDICDHGLVYADYYFLVIGNKLLQLGLY